MAAAATILAATVDENGSGAWISGRRGQPARVRACVFAERKNLLG